MVFWTLSVIVSWLLVILAIAGLTDSKKDLELLILRHQVAYGENLIYDVFHWSVAVCC